MSARRGWCPDVHAPMQSGDGWLVRVKPPEQRLPAAMVRAVATAASRFGSGVIEVTGRGNLQLRGLAPAALPRVAAAMVACGAALADPVSERRRSVIVSPLAGDDPSVAPATLEVARSLLAWLRCIALPPKFGVVVDGGGVLPLDGVRADLRVRVRADHAEIIAAGPASADAAPPVGFLPYAGTSRGAFAVAPPFGQGSAAMLVELAALSERFGDGLIRVAPTRTLLIGGVQEADAAPLAAALQGWVVDAADPRLRVVACAGRPACAAAAGPARQDAAVLAPLLRPGQGIVHVSGCAKGCAHAAAASATLVGAADGYALVVHGRAGDPPSLRGLSIAQAAALLG